MRKLIASLQMSLDGFIAGPNGEMDWILDGKEEWVEMFKDLHSIDTVLLGRKMYPGYAAHWQAVLAGPESNPDLLEYAKWADNTPHIVFSRTLTTVSWKNTRIANDAKEETSTLKQQSGKNIMVWGGATLISALLRFKLLDELRITLVPVILGEGLSLFKDLKGRKELEHLNTSTLSSGGVLLRYRVIY